MSPESVQMLFALCARLCRRRASCSGYQLLTSRLPSFSLLARGPGATALAAVPLLVFGALHHHAQHHPRPPHRGPPLRVRDAGDRDRRLLEPDVGHRGGDGVAGQRLPARLARFPIQSRSWQVFARARTKRRERCNADLRARRTGAGISGRRQLLGRRDRGADRPRAAEEPRQRLVRRGAARRQRMDRDSASARRSRTTPRCTPIRDFRWRSAAIA